MRVPEMRVTTCIVMNAVRVTIWVVGTAPYIFGVLSSVSNETRGLETRESRCGR